jgi:hypothetical protein
VTADEILAQLDACSAEFTFPMLDNGYIYHVDQRLTVYRNETAWLMMIEILGVNSRTASYDSFQNCLHVFGSPLQRPPGTANEDFLQPVDGCPDSPLFDDEYEWMAREDANCVLIRGHRIELDLSPAALANKGITLIDLPRIDPVAILRSLVPEHRTLLLGTAAELAARNPQELPPLLQLDEWNHPDVGSQELPSESQTFRMLADAIVTGDKSRYAPTLPPNTHWKNWPEGGTL